MQIKQISNYVIIKEQNKKKLMNEIKKNRKLFTIFIPSTEPLLRFALEKTNVDAVMGMEKIHPKEHTHYVRSGLDQVLCKIAAAKGKTIVFDFNEISESKNLGKLLARIRLNIKLCKKYKVKMLFTDLANRVSLQDLTSVVKVVKVKKDNNVYKNLS